MSNRQSNGHSETWNPPNKREAAKIAVRKILAAYPNTSEKASRDYILFLVETLERYPLAVISRVADPQCGITLRHPSYLPNQGQIVEFANEVEDRMRKLQQPTAAQRIAATPKQEPVPSLQTVEERKAFVAKELGYEVGPKGSKASSTWCFPVKAPTFDISDFPDRS